MKKKLVKFWNWIVFNVLKAIRSVTMQLHKLLAPTGDFIFFTVFKGQRYLELVCQNRNTATAHVIILIKDFLKWDALNDNEKEIARKTIVEELGYVVRPATRKKSKSKKDPEVLGMLDSSMVSVCLNGHQVPLVQSFNMSVDIHSNLVLGTIEYLHPKYYKQELEHFGKATVHRAPVYVQRIRKKGIITIIDVIVNEKLVNKHDEYTYGFLRKVADGKDFI